eukprot:TRINITY_DN36648_c0_g1_i1.p1 TRINITY_DN36648_c0_g1~~TRINITY_DN36648_c0_g1_i1.p1  ORF type:complete len:1279 (-),score=235.12 TRINITY_DN36648_c0_g1_i1:8-3844(-)
MDKLEKPVEVQALELPQAVQPGRVLRPNFDVYSLAELEGSPYLLSVDGRGATSCWDVSPATERKEPVHFFQAHKDAIHQVLVLKSHVLYEAIEVIEENVRSGRWSTSSGALLQQVQSEAEAVGDATDVTALPKDPAALEVEPTKSSGSQAGQKRSLAERCLPCCCGRHPFLRSQHWLVATASEDGSVRVWRWRLLPARSRAAKDPAFCPLEVDWIAEWVAPGVETRPIKNCLELYDGQLAVSFKTCNDVHLVDLKTSTVTYVLYGHTKMVTAIAECGDGRLVTGGEDGAVRLWARRNWTPKHSPRGAAKDTLRGAADTGFDEFSEFHAPPAAPAVVWEDPEQTPESPRPGVCDMAYFAHMQQAQRGEIVGLCLRVMVHSAQHLPKADIASLSDPYVICTLLDGNDVADDDTTAETQTSRTGNFSERVKLKIQRSQISGSLQWPECSMLNFEVVLQLQGLKSLLPGAEPPRVVARCSIPLKEVLDDIAKDPTMAEMPKARRLFSPLGEGPYEVLEDAAILLGFTQVNEDTIGLLVEQVQGIPVASGERIFVRASVKQSCTGTVRRLPAKVRDVTSVKPNTCNPFWGEILEFEVPVFIGDRHITHSHDYRLHFQLYDRDILMSDDKLAELFVPLSEALARDGEPVRRYPLTLEKGLKAHVVKGSKKGSAVAPSDSDAWGRPATPQGARSSADSPEQEAIPSLCLGFQAIVPCPKQLRVEVERVTGGLIGGQKIPISVRMRFVEGNPAMPCTTAVRTSWKSQTLKPVWRERCALDVPKTLREFADKSLRSDAVKKGWVHEWREGSLETVVCVDIYDRDPISGVDNYLCRGFVPFYYAWKAAREGTAQRPRAVSLSHSPEARLYLGFELGGTKDEPQLVVIVDSAEKLEGRDASGYSDPFCIVRLADLSALGEPTDKAQLSLNPVETGPGRISTGRGDVHFNHEDILELPGALVDGTVAARHNWYLQLDVLERKKQVVLGSASVPVEKVLNDIVATEGPLAATNTALSIRERLEDMRSTFHKQAEVDPFLDESRCKTIVRTLDVEQLDKPYKKSKDANNAEVKDRKVGESIGSAFVNLGFRKTTERKDLGINGVQMVCRFQVVSRWKGCARGSRSPPSAPMPGVSPVTCIATLASAIVAGHKDGNVFVWDTSGRSSAPLHQFQAHRVPVNAIAVLAPLGVVVTAGEVRNGEEAMSDSLIRLWSSVNLELRQSVSLHGSVARCLTPLVFGAGIEETMHAIEKASQKNWPPEKVEKVVPPCLAVATDSRHAKALQLMRVNVDKV